jgi:hypothetical protein
MQPPNIRSTIIPDPGHVLVEVDLKQADAQIVTWESNDEPLKSLFRLGVDIYTEQQSGVWSDPRLPASRQTRKNCIHSINYGAGYRTLAERYMGTEAAAKHFIAAWFTAHPSIDAWQRGIAWEMQQSLTPCIRNIWGYRRVYACPTPITQPLAWIGQSTVARINKQMLRNYDEADLPLPKKGPTLYTSINGGPFKATQQLEVLMPHHDSVLLQVPAREVPMVFPDLLQLAMVPVPYPDPLTIPAELKWSERSWGHMQKWKPDAGNQSISQDD